ncbi:hypothetical protein [Mucilaginibacter rubeus]|uniref:Lipocalin-like domain-containing protein n=1 Tax=Mucilaginibacter rubeus TaxID=2027860 RepID=A0A5C1HZJ3_9SPHI|nr:hypothetical protein [Mucilaginibacter rubeus]QEM10338.1 hypothetical protein DEO27_009985 [Mucilaginibacter rubeus]
MKKLFLPAGIALLLCSFNLADSPLKGNWEYRGGKINGKLDAAPTAYKLQRIYDDEHYNAKVMEEGEETVVYEKGDYQLKEDTCFETQTYCMQESKLLNKTIKYNYTISNDTLKLLSVLPNGNKVEDYWVKVK